MAKRRSATWSVAGAALLLAVSFGAGPSRSGPPVARAVIPGTNGRILYEGPGPDIYTMKPDGTDVMNITNDAFDDRYASWSPDGTKIVFQSNRVGSNWEIFTMNADGSAVAPVEPSVDGDLEPAWSPGGDRFAFIRPRNVGTLSYTDIWTVNANGTSPTQLTTTDTVDRAPAYSPDGTRIAFIRDGKLAMMNANGTSQATIVSSLDVRTGPSWSPDGLKIAFGAGGNSSAPAQIYLVKPDGSGLLPSTPLSWVAYAQNPAWSPDGRRIVFDGEFGVMTMGADDTCPIRLQAPGAFGFNPDWQGHPVEPLALSTTPLCKTVFQGQSVSFTVNLARLAFTSAVTLSISGLPAGVTAAFTPNPTSTTTATLTLTTSICPVSTPAADYTMTITGTGGGLVETATINLEISDGPPKVSGPYSQLYSASTLGTTTTPVRTSWSACNAAHYIDTYEANWQINNGSWMPLVSSHTTTAINQSLSNGSLYRYRVRASGSGTSAYSYGAGFEPLVTQQTNTAITYSGTWSTAYLSSDSGGSAKYAKSAGASASYRFVGTSIGWVTYRGPDRGSARIYIDGSYKATMSLYAATASARKIMYVVNWSSQGTHTIKIVVAGTVGHPRVDIDAFVRLYRI